jgi:hypothetical protein
MWSRIIVLALFGVAVFAERITIGDYQGPEEEVSRFNCSCKFFLIFKAIVAQAIKFFNKATGDNFEVIGEIVTEKDLYSGDQELKEYRVSLNYISKSYKGRYVQCATVFAVQYAYDKILITKIKHELCTKVIADKKQLSPHILNPNLRHHEIVEESIRPVHPGPKIASSLTSSGPPVVHRLSTKKPFVHRPRFNPIKTDKLVDG